MSQVPTREVCESPKEYIGDFEGSSEPKEARGMGSIRNGASPPLDDGEVRDVRTADV